ncbi:hypothetical protein PG985_009587 [Apiospora marii]|uniref:2EXR domain-containing protein n=1 Tax=Apiospora marii TaxID=335849 RepID=A0ABR1RFQ1_9PEZI
MPPACFNSLPPELSGMIWQLALEEEAESRMIVVHRSTMRVLPHRTAENRVMNVNQDSRSYALRLFYDFQVDVRTFEADFSLIDDMALYGEAENIFRDRTVMKAYRGVGGDVLKLLRTGHSGELKGVIYFNSQRDRFALASTKKDTDIPWRILGVDMCQRAFVPNSIISDICMAMDADRRQDSRNFNVNPANFTNDFFNRHIGGKLPNKAIKRIRRVVHLHAGPQPTGWSTHACGPAATLRSRDWKLGTFKGAQQLYTAQLAYIASSTNLGIRNLLEWRKTEADGHLGFACTCQEAEGQDDAHEENKDETSLEG